MVRVAHAGRLAVIHLALSAAAGHFVLTPVKQGQAKLTIAGPRREPPTSELRSGRAAQPNSYSCLSALWLSALKRVYGRLSVCSAG
jgi:hypothetical protein